MSKVDVEQLRLRVRENFAELINLPPRNLPRGVTQLLEPKAAEEMRRRLAGNDDFFEWIPIRFFAFLRDDARLASPQRDDLPIDVEHLRLQECRAVTCDHRRRGSRSRGNDLRQNRKAKSLMPLHFPASLWRGSRFISEGS